MRNCLSIASEKNWWTFKTIGATTLATVVVVDDHSFIRKFLRTVLTARGHQVFDEGSGEDALALCGAVHPDILIADLLMPGVDGYELVRRLRSNQDTAGTRVIFFTGLPKGNEAQCLAERSEEHTSELQSPCNLV